MKVAEWTEHHRTVEMTHGDGSYVGQLKRELAELCDRQDLLFADVALMSPVPGRGVRTAMLVSGTGAEGTAGG